MGGLRLGGGNLAQIMTPPPFLCFLDSQGQQLLQAGMNATHTEDKKVHVALMVRHLHCP